MLSSLRLERIQKNEAEGKEIKKALKKVKSGPDHARAQQLLATLESEGLTYQEASEAWNIHDEYVGCEH